MALRVLIIIVLSFQFNSFAASKSKTVYNIASKLHNQKKYTKSNQYISKKYSLKKAGRIPSQIQLLIAKNYFYSKKYAKAVFYFNQVIRKRYIKKHRSVIKSLKNDSLDEAKISKNLNSIYFYMGQSYQKLFVQNHRQVNADKAKRFLTICDEQDYNDVCSELLEELEVNREFVTKSINKFEFFISIGSLVFQDTLNLQQSSGENNDIIANNSALCYGAGIRYGNSFSGYQLAGCTFTGAATVENADSSTVRYKQAGVPIAGILVDGGYYIKPISDSARLGLSLPIIIRNGSYQEPSGYSFENKQQTSYGLSLNAGWEISFFELYFKLANMQNTNLFSIQGLVNF